MNKDPPVVSVFNTTEIASEHCLLRPVNSKNRAQFIIPRSQKQQGNIISFGESKSNYIIHWLLPHSWWLLLDGWSVPFNGPQRTSCHNPAVLSQGISGAAMPRPNRIPWLCRLTQGLAGFGPLPWPLPGQLRRLRCRDQMSCWLMMAEGSRCHGVSSVELRDGTKYLWTAGSTLTPRQWLFAVVKYHFHPYLLFTTSPTSTEASPATPLLTQLPSCTAPSLKSVASCRCVCPKKPSLRLWFTALAAAVTVAVLDWHSSCH